MNASEQPKRIEVMGMRRVKGLKRSPIKSSGKPMRRNTPKRAKADRAARKPRQTFLEGWNVCWFCEAAPAECVHEMAAGSARKAAYQHRFAWAVACSDCNCHRLTDNGPRGEWPHARQLAVKWIWDRENFNRVEFNRLMRPKAAETFITMAEIIPHVCRLLDGRDCRGRF